MDFKVPKNQEQSEQLQDEELEAMAGWRLDDLVKNLSLRGKVARRAAVAVSVVAIAVGMAMPSQALKRDDCLTNDSFQIYQGGGRSHDSRSNSQYVPTMCFVDSGHLDVLIADVHFVDSGNNVVCFKTNKGDYCMGKKSRINFIRSVGTVTITYIKIL